MTYRIPFSGRAHTFEQHEIDTMVEAAKTAVPLTQGKYLKAFEEKFNSYLGISHSFAVCNATAALEMSAQLCQFDEGDEVIIPAHTFTATAYPYLKNNATIKWADIDRETRVVSLDTIKACLSNKTKAIVVVHLYGYAIDMEPIANFAKENNYILIEDVAQALGAEVDEKKAGTFGDYAAFSFHSHKNVSTLGEGGILVVKDPNVAKLIPMLRHNGHCAFDYERESYWIPAMGNVDLPELNGKTLWPNNYCLGEVECAIGVELLDRIDRLNAEKRQRAMQFIKHFENDPKLNFHRVDSTRHTYHLLVAEARDGLRDAFIKNISEEGVQCIVQYYPLYNYDLYKKVNMGDANCPQTDAFFDNMVSFPFHHCMSDDDFNFMIETTQKVLNKI